MHVFLVTYSCQDCDFVLSGLGFCISPLEHLLVFWHHLWTVTIMFVKSEIMRKGKGLENWTVWPENIHTSKWLCAMHEEGSDDGWNECVSHSLLSVSIPSPSPCPSVTSSELEGRQKKPNPSTISTWQRQINLSSFHSSPSRNVFVF